MTNNPLIYINDRAIGSGMPPYIIAELSAIITEILVEQWRF